MKNELILFLTLLASVFLLLSLVSATDITNCSVINSSNGTYTLTNNIRGNLSCLDINASSVYVDCAGYNITGWHNGTGINITGVFNVTVSNCRVQNFSRGVHIELSNITVLDGLNIVSNNATNESSRIHAGVYVVKSMLGNISSCNISSNHGGISAGVYLNESTNFTILNNAFSKNLVNGTAHVEGGGIIGLVHSNYTTIQNNNLTDNVVNSSEEGYLRGGAILGIYSSIYTSVIDSLLTHNIVFLFGNVSGGGLIGLYNESNHSSLTNNIIINNNVTLNYSLHGGGIIGLFNVSNVTVDGNNLTFNNFSSNMTSSAGSIGLNASSNNIISNNVIDGKNLSIQGLFLGPDCGTNRIFGNTITNFTEIGAFVEAPNTLLENNTFSHNHVGLVINATVNLTNGNFSENQDWGVNTTNQTINWFINGIDAYIANNNISFNGSVSLNFSNNVSLEIDNNSFIRINESIINLTGNVSNFEVVNINMSDNTANFTDFPKADANLTLFMNDTIRPTPISVMKVIPGAAPSTDPISVKGIDIDAGGNISSNLTWAYFEITYNQATDIDEQNLDESTLSIYYYNDSAGTPGWVLEQTQGVNVQENKVWANVTHFSLFGIFGTNNAQTVQPGSGSSSSSSSDDDDEVECSESWVCASWSACTSGTQTRDCFDANSCGTTSSKPSVSKSCAVAQPTPTTTPEPTPREQPARDVTAGQAVATPEDTGGSSAWIYGLGVIIALIVIWVVVMLVKKNA